MPLPFEESNPKWRSVPEMLPGQAPEPYGAKLRRLAKSPHYYEVMQEQGWGEYDDRGRFRIRQNPDDARLEALIAERDRRIATENEIKKQQSSPEYLLAQAKAERMRREAESFETPAQRSARELENARQMQQMELEFLPKRRAAMRPEADTPEGKMQELQRQALEAQIASSRRAADWAGTTGMGGENEGMTPELAAQQALAKRMAARRLSSGMVDADRLKADLDEGLITQEQYRSAIANAAKRRPVKMDLATTRAEINKEGAWFSDPDVSAIADELAPYVNELVDNYGIEPVQAVRIIESKLPPSLAKRPSVQEALLNLQASAFGSR